MTSREKLADMFIKGVIERESFTDSGAALIRDAFLAGYDACAKEKDAEAAVMRQALEHLLFHGREAYDNGYPDMELAVCEAKEALSSTAGADMLADLKALRKVASRVANGVGIDDLDLIQEARDALEGK